VLFDSLRTSLENVSHTLTVILDKKPGDPAHFTEMPGVRIVDVLETVGACGSDSASFRAAMAVAKNLDGIIVFLEDDYVCTPDWHLVQEGLRFGDYVTLYDHPDKYEPQYEGIPCTVHKGKYRHWRTTPSTTNSYAMTSATLKRDWDIHAEYCKGSGITLDHPKFLALWQHGRRLVSCIPSAWSHEEVGMSVDVYVCSTK
jgi:hypothetical protein